MICSKCGQDKIETEFRIANKISGRRRRDCRSCERASNKIYLEKNAESVSERQRRNREKRGKDYSTRMNKRHSLKRSQNYYSNKEISKARWMSNAAIRSGKIKRKPCAVCGNPNTDGHHEDYSRPLDLIFLCRKHHLLRHSEIKKEKKVSS